MKTAVTTNSYRIIIGGILSLPDYVVSDNVGAGSTTTVTDVTDVTDVEPGGVLEFHSGDNNGVKRLITSKILDDINHDAAPVAASSGDAVKCTDNNLFFLEDTGGDATKVQDATHTELANYFKGAYVEAVQAANNSGSYEITASASGEISCILTGVTVAAELYLPYICEEGTVDVSIEQLNVDRGSYGGVVGAVGQYPTPLYDASGNVEINVKKLAARAGDGVLAGMCPFLWLFGSGLKVVRGTGSAVSGAASTTTTVDITNGDGGNFTAGDLICVNGELTQVMSIDDTGDPDTLTVYPAITAASAADVVYAGVTLSPVCNDEGYYVSLGAYKGDFEEVISTGRIALSSIKGERGQAVKAAGSFVGGYSFIRPVTRAYDCQYFNSGLIISHATRVQIDGTEYGNISSFEFSPDVQLAKIAGLNQPDGVTAIKMTDAAGTLTVTMQVTSATYTALKTLQESRKTINVLLTIGDCNTNGGLGICLHKCQLSGMPEFPDTDGEIEMALTFTPVIDSDYVDIPVWAVTIF